MHDQAEKYRRFKAVAKKLKKLAEATGQVDYNIRPCYGGSAVEGEAILHTPEYYVSVKLGPRGNRDASTVYRTVSGMHDHTGGPNHWCSEIPEAPDIRMMLRAKQCAEEHKAEAASRHEVAADIIRVCEGVVGDEWHADMYRLLRAVITGNPVPEEDVRHVLRRIGEVSPGCVHKIKQKVHLV